MLTVESSIAEAVASGFKRLYDSSSIEINSGSRRRFSATVAAGVVEIAYIDKNSSSSSSNNRFKMLTVESSRAEAVARSQAEAAAVAAAVSGVSVPVQYSSMLCPAQQKGCSQAPC